MPVGFAMGEALKILDAIARGVNYIAPTAFWLQLHVGDPGAAGTANVAGNATRKQVTFATAAAAANNNTQALISNTAAVSWTSGEVDTSESYAYWTAWTASSGGTFIGSGTASGTVTVGQPFTIAIGQVDLALPVASG